jgi:hypothetical protein
MVLQNVRTQPKDYTAQQPEDHHLFSHRCEKFKSYIHSYLKISLFVDLLIVSLRDKSPKNRLSVYELD